MRHGTTVTSSTNCSGGRRPDPERSAAGSLSARSPAANSPGQSLSRQTEGFSVAVVIAARDAEATLGRAMASALAEPDCAELVVVDDGSRDATHAVASSFDDPAGRLRIIRLPQSVGPAAARNIGIVHTSAPFVAILDADDYWLPGRLARIARHVPGYDVIADDVQIVQEGQESGPTDHLIAPSFDPFDLAFTQFVLHNIGQRGRYRREWGFLKPVVRREFLERWGLAYDPSLRLGEDFILYAQALARGARFKVVERCGYVSVERRDSLSDTHTGRDLVALLNAARRLASGPLGREEVRAMRRYLWQLKTKTRYRQFIDVRRQGGLKDVASLLLAHIDTLPLVLLGRLSRALHSRTAQTLN